MKGEYPWLLRGRLHAMQISEPVPSAGPDIGGATLLTAEENFGQQSIGGHGVHRPVRSEEGRLENGLEMG